MTARFGADLADTAYWSRPAQRTHVAAPRTQATAKEWLAGIVAGLLLGYSARLAFGCNVGGYFSGISTGSLHGWVWFASAFAGSVPGMRLRAAPGSRRG